MVGMDLLWMVIDASRVLVDAAGESDGAWSKITSPDERLFMKDKVSVLLVSGIAAAVGNQILGLASDVYGRIRVTECCILNGVIAVFGFMLARTKLTLMLFVCINPFLKDGAGMITSSMLAEWLPIEWRGIFLVSQHAFWNVGRLLITIVWAVIPPNEHWVLHYGLAATLPVALSIYLRARGWRYESPRWLAVTSKMESCITNLKLAADTKTNDEELPSGWDDPQVLKCSSSTGAAVLADRSVWTQLPDLMNSEMSSIVVMLSVIFFGLYYASLGYFYWLIEYLKLTGLHDAIIPCMTASPTAKILANLGLIVGGRGTCIIDRSRRITLMQIGLFGFAVTIPLLFVTTNVFAITAVVFIGEFCQEITWAGACIYVTEAFPTSVRNTAAGLIFTLGQTGGILSSTVSGKMMESSVYLPMMVMAGILCFSGSVCWLLPNEDHQKPLTDTTISSRGKDKGEEYNSCKGAEAA